MTTPAALQPILVTVIAVAVGGSILAVLRKKLTPKAPLTAACIAAVAAIVAIKVAASSLGFSAMSAVIWLVLGSFLGSLAVQPRPRETRSVLRALALAAGFVSLYAALEPNVLALIFGIGVSGVLLKLSASTETPRS